MKQIETIRINGKEVDEINIGGKTWSSGIEVTLSGTSIVAPNIVKTKPVSFSVLGDTTQHIDPSLNGTFETVNVENLIVEVSNGDTAGNSLQRIIIPYVLRGNNIARDRLVINSNGTMKLIQSISKATFRGVPIHQNASTKVFCSSSAGYPYVWFYTTSYGSTFQNSARPAANASAVLSSCDFFPSVSRKYIDSFNGAKDDFIGECIFSENIIISKERIGLRTDMDYSASECTNAFKDWVENNDFFAWLTLLNPVEIQLPSEQAISLLPVLYKPATTIWNNQNAGMELVYKTKVSAATNALEAEYKTCLEELGL